MHSRTEDLGETAQVLREILSEAERWIDYLISRKKIQAAVLAVIAGVAIWPLAIFLFAVFDALMGNLLSPLFPRIAATLGMLFLIATTGASLAVGFFTYLWARRRYLREFNPWKELVNQLKSREAALEAPGEVEQVKQQYQSTLETVMKLIDQINRWLPQIQSYRLSATLLYGAAAFAISAVVTKEMTISLLMGILIWLYFRFERRRDMEREARRADERKALFRRGIDDLIASMAR